jgi:uncharacterized protein YutE (UPF0331/DUF86 family)
VVDVAVVQRKLSQLDTYLQQVSESLHDSLEKMAKFRNIVVHQYEGVDAGIVLTILKNHLVDFERFRDAVLAYLGSTEA